MRRLICVIVLKQHKQFLFWLGSKLLCQRLSNKKRKRISNIQLVISGKLNTHHDKGTDHLDSEIFPRSLGYTSFRRYRASGTKGGGVFILVKDTLISSLQKTLGTDCEVIWIKIEAARSKPVYLAAYHRPHENNFHSFEEFCKSVDMVSKKNGHIWILGDLNYPKFHWNDNHVPQVKQGCSFPQQYDDFINLLDDNNLIQMVSEPTRQDNTLDLFLTNNDSLVNKVTLLPGISDHDIVSCMVRFKPIILKQVPRVMPLYSLYTAGETGQV